MPLLTEVAAPLAMEVILDYAVPDTMRLLRFDGDVIRVKNESSSDE
jgi:hypothetical protein